MSAKEQVAALLKSLPDDCSLEDIQYHLYVLEKVKAGREEVDQRETLTQEEVDGTKGVGCNSKIRPIPSVRT